MDFDPQHPKWLCCCCHLTNGLMILAGSEIILSVALLAYSITHIAVLNSNGQVTDTSWFMLVLAPLSVIFAITSALLIYGIHGYKENFMYPTLAGRAIIIIFVQAFGVSTVVQPSDSMHDPETHKSWKLSESQELSNFANDRD
ncbi:unnamed protein product [Gongylonema pulchrum]|uniref:Transmembrane protein 107 n=1 Tax=Gongylonema pulchrum TaxID=637853 RepID=A0A183EII2_9BILA|nr:unnamed protein product [Gongylonema pulchrum]